MSTLSDTPRLLHEWTVTITREEPETTTETLNGQPVQVTRKVPKPVDVRMGLRDLSRKERRAASLFYDSRLALYAKPPYNLLLASELTNRLINTTGGVLTDKEKSRVEQLRARHVELDLDIARATADPALRAKLQSEQANIRVELVNLNAINEEVYSRTADANAQNDLNNWVTFQAILIHRDGKWQPFFEGQAETMDESFRLREESMWRLEETKDPVYEAAVGKIAAVVFWFNRGANSPEAFKLMEEELAKQEALRRKAREDEEAAAKAAQAKAESVPEPAPVAAPPTAAPAPQPSAEPVAA